VNLCVLLWAREGQESALVEYEDTVLWLVEAHGGRVLQRARSGGLPGEPLEIHLLEFPSEEAFAGYMIDERRTVLADYRNRAIERTEVVRVSLV
jgi:uncharacterized protein (DUF1330 family)